MKKHLVLGTALVLALVPATAIAQTADDTTETTPEAPAVKTKTTKATSVSYKGGKLRVTEGKKKKAVTYIVDKKTNCGYSEGQMGGEMPCSNLAKKKYLTKPVRVTWYTDAKKRKVATLVSVDMVKKK